VRRYLSQIPIIQAVSLLKDSFPCPHRTEIIQVCHASGRIVASPVFAPDTVPDTRIAAMDGIAVKSIDTISAQDQNPGELSDVALINTGQDIPDEYDAIIPAEELWSLSGDKYQIRKPARSSQHIRMPGEDIQKGRLILIPDHQITPSDIGALLTFGITEVEVRCMKVGLIPTGDELISSAEKPKPGQVRESNTAVLAAYLIQAGAHPIRYPITPDNPGLIRDAIRTAHMECDLVIVSAGSSAGTRDHTREVIEELGTILFHGVAIRPGKSLLCGEIEGRPILGLPGQPMANQTAWREIGSHLLDHWGFRSPELPLCSARVAEAIPSDGGIDEFVMVSVVWIGGENMVLPRPRGAAGQMNGIRANGILHVPASKEGYHEGATVKVRMTRENRKRGEILIAGISNLLTDYLQILFSMDSDPVSDVQPTQIMIRPMSPIGASASLYKGACHAVIIKQSDIMQGTDACNLMKSAGKSRLISIGIGESDGEGILLIYQENPEILKEISPLLNFLESDKWAGSTPFPEGYSPKGAGLKKELLSEDSCNNALHPAAESISEG
jgi:putative molybdopterin biosynthesis protein